MTKNKLKNELEKDHEEFRKILKECEIGRAHV